MLSLLLEEVLDLRQVTKLLATVLDYCGPVQSKQHLEPEQRSFCVCFVFLLKLYEDEFEELRNRNWLDGSQRVSNVAQCLYKI